MGGPGRHPVAPHRLARQTLALPTEENARTALRTQQIIAHESGVINTIDPLGCSYFVEEMTRRMVDGAFDYFRRIDQFGGMVEAIEAGFPQRELMEVSFRYQMAVEKGEKLIVGVNAFQALAAVLGGTQSLHLTRRWPSLTGPAGCVEVK